MDLDGLLERYTITAVPRRARYGIVWQKAAVWPVPALDSDLEFDLRAYVVTHVPRRSRSGLVWTAAPVGSPNR